MDVPAARIQTDMQAVAGIRNQSLTSPGFDAAALNTPTNTSSACANDGSGHESLGVTTVANCMQSSPDASADQVGQEIYLALLLA